MNQRRRHKRERDMSKRALELHTKKIVHSTKMYNLMADIFNLGAQLNEDMNDFSDELGGKDADMESDENLEKFIEHVGDKLMPFLNEFYSVMPKMIELFQEDEQLEEALAEFAEETQRYELESSFGEGGIN
tara:strand:+ start:676 stop:1068 length:393 start_codon:yes stop_codon:yes gene_type:complete